MYCYQHANGEVIAKPDIVVDRGGGPAAYFTGPFVRQWWRESDLLQPEPRDLGDVWRRGLAIAHGITPELRAPA